jgi:thioredoxin 1
MRSVRKKAVALLILALAVGCGGSESPSSSSPPSNPTWASDPRVVALSAGNFDNLVLSSTRPSMVEFYSTTCPHCQAMAPVVSRLAVDFEGRALVGGVNVAEEGALTQRHGVTAVPTFVFFRGGREVSRVVGETSYENLAAPLRSLIGS